MQRARISLSGACARIHTNGTFYGWASVALTGVALYVTSRTSGVPLFAKPLAWASLVLYNVAAIVGTVTLGLGLNNGDQEYREWIWWAAMPLLVAIVLSGISVFGTVVRRSEREMYLSNWYFIVGFVSTAILEVVSALPYYQHGLGQVAVQGFYMHNSLGMWFTFLALGTAYYVLPKLLNRPIYSYSLGILGVWTNLLFYPVIGAHHFEFSPLPWWFQTLAIVFSVGMLIPVWAGSGNFLLTLRGGWEAVRRSPSLPFLVVGIAYYFLGSTQGTVEALRTSQAYWHFTNFTVGHSHATMYGFITFIAWGAAYALLPRATGKPASALATGMHFWLALVGVTMYVLALSAAGTAQGLAWVAGNPFISSVESAGPFWVARAVAGLMMFASHVLFAYNVYRMTLARHTPAAVASALTREVAAV